MNHQILWQQYMERIESLSPESKVSRFCKEAGFMRIVEVGQYLVTKDTGSLRKFRSVACREYTLPRDDPSSQPKGWIQGNIRIGPVLAVTTSFQHFKFGIEVRIKSMKEDNSQSWVRISYGTIRLCEQLHQVQHSSCKFTRRESSTSKFRSDCSQIESKSETSTEGILWHDDHSIQ